MSTSSSSSQSARPSATSASSNANEQVRSRNSGQLSLSDIFLKSDELFLLLPKTDLIVCLRIGSSNLWAICYDRCKPKFNALGSADDSVFSQCLGKIIFSSCSFLFVLHNSKKRSSSLLGLWVGIAVAICCSLLNLDSNEMVYGVLSSSLCSPVLLNVCCVLRYELRETNAFCLACCT